MVNYSFFAIIEGALKDLADGPRFFELLADDIEMEFVFAPPGTPTGIKTRQAIIDSFHGYGDILVLDTAQLTNRFVTDKPGVVILQYACQGKGVQTGKPYDQHYVSILTIRNRKVVHWTDYWDPLVSIQAIGGTNALKNAMYDGG